MLCVLITLFICVLRVKFFVAKLDDACGHFGVLWMKRVRFLWIFISYWVCIFLFFLLFLFWCCLYIDFLSFDYLVSEVFPFGSHLWRNALRHY